MERLDTRVVPATVTAIPGPFSASSGVLLQFNPGLNLLGNGSNPGARTIGPGRVVSNMGPLVVGINSSSSLLPLANTSTTTDALASRSSLAPFAGLRSGTALNAITNAQLLSNRFNGSSSAANTSARTLSRFFNDLSITLGPGPLSRFFNGLSTSLLNSGTSPFALNSGGR